MPAVRIYSSKQSTSRSREVRDLSKFNQALQYCQTQFLGLEGQFLGLEELVFLNQKIIHCTNKDEEGDKRIKTRMK